jgi:hypothetical protein
LEAVLFLGGTVLWAFVFAWHLKYTGQPVFKARMDPLLLGMVTTAGIGAALLLFFVMDPRIRDLTPADYPRNVAEWAAMTLFSLAFTQVFLVFAPFAWLMRLFREKSAAIGLTAMFGFFVIVLKNQSSPTPIPIDMFSALLAFRVATGLFSIYCYLQGGALLLWWWVLLLESRHLPSLLTAN